VLTAGRVIGGLVLLKGVDLGLTGTSLLLLGAWLLGGLLLLRDHDLGWPVVLVAGLAVAAASPVELRRQHLVLLLGVALVATVTRDDRERLLLWRTQLSVLYGVAVLAKLNEAFLSGTVLTEALRVPLPLAAVAGLGVGLIAVEALLAATPWVGRLRRPGTAVAATLHGVALVVVAGGPLVTLRLAVFGGTAVLLHAVSAGLVPLRPSGSLRP
jgi:hypothetical protein